MLKSKEAQVLKAIYKYICEIGYSPTIREIGALVSLSSTSILQRSVLKLQANGYIEKKEMSLRAIELTDKGMKFLRTLEG